MGRHIQIERGWFLIQEVSPLSAAEAEHLETCDDCEEFLQGFISVARHLGFSVYFPSRDDGIDRDRAA
jgi:hypothetical protein